jgi:hypothetical protein
VIELTNASPFLFADDRGIRCRKVFHLKLNLFSGLNGTGVAFAEKEFVKTARFPMDLSELSGVSRTDGPSSAVSRSVPR